MHSKTLRELATEIGADLVGDGDVVVSSVNTLQDARPGQLSFLANPKYEKDLESTQASGVIVAANSKFDRVPTLRAKDPQLTYQRAVLALHGPRRHPHMGVHPQAFVDATASVGEGTVIYPGAYVGPQVRIGRDCVLFAGVIVYERCAIGDRVVIHGGSVIGADG
ncbi:MAG TPA: LpxD N-terminal domain-containing protein, partial [Tepidisphaeraceae bacterium]|nr:LpxD N-terminal domain-containing protein [Tepidisphaeraceae bacterium]